MLANLKTAAVVAAMGLGLAACETSQTYNIAKQAAPAGDSYQQALFKNYMMLGASERREEDWSDWINDQKCKNDELCQNGATLYDFAYCIVHPSC